MSSDAEDASPSPEPDTELDESEVMAEEKLERASSDEKSPALFSNNGNSQPPKSSAKDPSRPRRKKARRACFACQRAHLTCGDERPCLRCIKRGLQDQCHDGVRKKAKYLHDAPAEALIPGFAPNFGMNGSHNIAAVPGVAPPGLSGLPGPQSGAYFPQNTAGRFPQYNPSAQPRHMGHPLMDSTGIVNDFNPSQTVGTPGGFPSTQNQQVAPNQEYSNAMDQTSSLGSGGNQSLDTAYFDPNDPSMFFNISELNFGNHYGALEFGMLGHISSGAVNTPDLNRLNVGDFHSGSMPFDGSGGFSGGVHSYNQGYPWQTIRQNSNPNSWAPQNNGLEAYAIGEQSSSITGASPRSQNQDLIGHQSAAQSPETHFSQPLPEHSQQTDLLRQSLSQAQQKRSPFPGASSTDGGRNRRQNASNIYSSVTTPYSYTQGFHALTAFLQKRYHPKKVMRIAKALATIRPSFISCNQNLDQGDLVFMEKCFQRTLIEYENFISHYGTPTLILRRTGEIAAVSKEFSLVTGWRRDVLLGEEPNLNVNTGGISSGPQTGTNSRGFVTPRVTNSETVPERPSGVFLAELMDEDSVVQFYEDFAEIAFGASRTTIMSTPCSLIKYRTKEDPGWGPNDHLTDDGKRIKQQGDIKPESLIRGEAGMNALGERDGRVMCQMCWTVKRDLFDIPMLIVMNLLPVI